MATDFRFLAKSSNLEINFKLISTPTLDRPNKISLVRNTANQMDNVVFHQSFKEKFFGISILPPKQNNQVRILKTLSPLKDKELSKKFLNRELKIADVFSLINFFLENREIPQEELAVCYVLLEPRLVPIIMQFDGKTLDVGCSEFNSTEYPPGTNVVVINNKNFTL